MPDAVTPEHLQQLLVDESIPAAHRALWALLWDGELRLDDLLSIDVRDIDFTSHTIVVDHPAKMQEPLTAPFSGWAGELLRQAIGGEREGPALHQNGRPISHETASRTARRAGVSIHGFRLGAQKQRQAA